MVSSETKTELHILSLDLETDPGRYACNGTNSEGTSQAVVTLRVRNRFAALWPFLGIVAEVLVLVTVIFIYEKRRKPDEVLDGEPTGPLLAVQGGGGWEVGAGHCPGVRDRGGRCGVKRVPGWRSARLLPGLPRCLPSLGCRWVTSEGSGCPLGCSAPAHGGC